MTDKKCPKCGKSFDESWELCDNCGIELVVPHVLGTGALFSSRLRDRFRRIDMALDSKMGKAVETADEAKESLDTITKKATVKATEITEAAEKKALVLEKKGLDLTRKMRLATTPQAVIDFILEYPKIILIAIILLTAIIGAAGIPSMLNNISGDMKIYLPQDDPAAKILNEVNEDWSTEMIVIFVETPNKFDKTYGTNITDYAVLDEMSRIEEAMDPQKEDEGKTDKITFVLSISTLIKEINVAPKNIAEAITDEIDPIIDPGPPPGDHEYAIPQDQDEIDRIVAQIPNDLKKLLVINTNDDDIWDSAGIIIGVHQDADQEKVMNDLYNIIDKFYIISGAEEGSFNSEDEWWNRIDAGSIHCAMTPTGPVPVTEALTARTYEEFSIILPAALILICGMLFILHRTPKIVLISGIPIFCSLIITMGIIGLTGWVLSPQVILVAPILLAIGVAYGLYIANRYSDEKTRIKDNKRRMNRAINTTGKAIFLSAVTTAVGFSSLMFVNMVPMRVLGFGLTVGILVCYGITMLMVPSLVMFLNYEKKAKIRSVEKLGFIPIRHKRKVVLFAIFITIMSLALLPAIKANMNLTEMAPQDEPSIKKMEEYSREFGGGQLGMVLVFGSSAPPEDQPSEGSGSMKDINVLDAIDRFEDELKKIKDPDDPLEQKSLINPPISIVDVMKMIKVPENIVNTIPSELLPPLLQTRIEDAANTSFWDLIHTAGLYTTPIWASQYGKSLQDSLINIFYNSLTTEMRLFLVNEDYSRALVYIDIPAMDAVKTKIAVEKVNDVVDIHKPSIPLSQLTGFAALLVAVNELIIENSLQSLAIALIIVFIVLIIIFRSLKYAGLTMIPVTLVVIWIPLTLWITGIDLNLITAMIGSIIVGIGIDYGIHMTERIKESGENFKGIKNSVETSGFTFLEATATIVAGLLSIFLINIRSIQEFITMVIILLIFSMMGAMLILPSIYAWLSSEKIKDQEFVSNPIEVEPEYRNP
jgi:predicted RND superfamily exporter protein